jgi:hypothetical protein
VMYNEDAKHRKAVVALIAIMLGVIITISWDCEICSIMQNPPDWIDSWYDGPDKWNLPEKGPAG